jgi:rhamnosyltransferase
MQKVDQKNIAGVVVLYESDMSVLRNIETYVNDIDMLYVVDNSANPNKELVHVLTKNNKIKYHSFRKNIGIGAALNWAACEAFSCNYVLLLTMDDDTSFNKSTLEQMISFWNETKINVGILSGVHNPLLEKSKSQYRLLPFTLTSGNFLNLQAFSEVGLFNEDLFIDHVDHEYGFRLNDSGYKVVELRHLSLNHKLGEKQVFSNRLFKIEYGAHSPSRMYYFTRNGLVLIKKYYKKYPKFLLTYVNEIAKRIVKILFFQDQKILRINMFYKGVQDGCRNKMGKLQ